MADLRPAKAVSLESFPFYAGTDPRLRAVLSKDLNENARQHHCSGSVEIRVDAAHARARSKIEDSKSTITTARVVPFKAKPSKGMDF